MGIFDEAGIDVNDIPSDPFGFGKEYHLLQIVDVRKPGVSASGKQYGTMIKWKCAEEEHAGMDSLGQGNWLQLPPPEHVKQETGMEFDPKSSNGRRCIFQIASLFKGLGIPADKMNSVEVEDLKGMYCMAKVFPKLNDEGFWQFNIVGHKPVPNGSEEGMEIFAKGGNSSGGGIDELERALAQETKNG